MAAILINFSFFNIHRHSQLDMYLKPVSHYNVREVAMWLEYMGISRQAVADLVKINKFDGYRLVQVTSSEELTLELDLDLREAHTVMVALTRYRQRLDQELSQLRLENDILVKQLTELDWIREDQMCAMDHIMENNMEHMSIASSDSSSSSTSASFAASLYALKAGNK
jgi:hypothetical protein